jgi:hypothetical protein
MAVLWDSWAGKGFLLGGPVCDAGSSVLTPFEVVLETAGIER